VLTAWRGGEGGERARLPPWDFSAAKSRMMDRSCFWGSAPGADADAAMGGEERARVAERPSGRFWRVRERGFGEEKREWSGRLALLDNWSSLQARGQV
jgi:hypothetical protein